MRIRRELEKYIYQSNEVLLHNFKNGSKGEDHFNKFIELLKEELKQKSILNIVSLAKFKDGIKGESDFLKFMYEVREDIAPLKIINLSTEAIKEIKDEIEKEFN